MDAVSSDMAVVSAVSLEVCQSAALQLPSNIWKNP